MVNQLKLMNPQAFISIFGNIPSFIGSELLDVQIKRDGPTLVIRLMTNEVVQSKPKRWDKWDVIYVELSFFAIRDLTITGVSTKNQINEFEIKEREKEAELEIGCDSQMKIKFLFDWARVEQITPGLIGTP
ncbi:MAG TPA: immunity 50 family protein [Pseudobacteroides sp.]|uniref:immunity 50 family protein n=1 Tax=Pseudobacteroides sp. TaxID=1968840 RepID=UPI002F94FDB3